MSDILIGLVVFPLLGWLLYMLIRIMQMRYERVEIWQRMRGHKTKRILAIEAHEERQRIIRQYWRDEQTRLWAQRTGLPAQDWMGGQVPKLNHSEMVLLQLVHAGKMMDTPIRPFPEKPIYR